MGENMITFRMTREGLEVMRFLPFMIFGNGEGGQNSSSDSPGPSITEKGGKNGKRNKTSNN